MGDECSCVGTLQYPQFSKRCSKIKGHLERVLNDKFNRGQEIVKELATYKNLCMS